ncbi:MAG: HAMP domain-containing sensor histidine kinase [bacterium]
MKLQFKNKLGHSSDFTLEHKILNSVIEVGIILSFFSSLLNFIIKMPLNTVYMSFFCGLGYLLLYWYSLKSKNYNRNYYLLFIYIIFVFAPVFWIINAGSLGGIPYYLILTLVLINITSKNNANYYLSSLLLVVIITLMVVENNFPQIIIQYQNKEARLLDIAVSIVSVFIGIFITLKIFMRLYRNALNSEIVQKQELQDKNELISDTNTEMEKLNQCLIERESQLIFTNEQLNEKKVELEKYSSHLEDLVSERTQELVVALNDVEKANKLKTEIIANMNHEIRTPLNFIKGSASLIKMSIDDINLNFELIDVFDSLNEGVSRLSRTLELFADLSSLKSGNYKPNISAFNLKNILEHFYLAYSKKILELQKPIVMTLNCSIDEAYIEGDEHNVEKTVEFIIDNAIKFTESGQVKINLEYHNNNKYLLTIEDSGIGIANEYKDKIYEPFSQEDMSTSRQYEGIGLSLALGKEYSIVNNFNISFDSLKGKGTKFYLEFNEYKTPDIND